MAMLKGLADDALALAITGGSGAVTLVGLDQLSKRVEMARANPRATAVAMIVGSAAAGIALANYVHRGVGMGVGTAGVAYGVVQLAGSFEATQALRLSAGMGPPLMGAGERARMMAGARQRLADPTLTRRTPIPGVDGLHNVDMTRVQPVPGVPVSGMTPQQAATLS